MQAPESKIEVSGTNIRKALLNNSHIQDMLRERNCKYVETENFYITFKYEAENLKLLLLLDQ